MHSRTRVQHAITCAHGYIYNYAEASITHATFHVRTYGNTQTNFCVALTSADMIAVSGYQKIPHGMRLAVAGTRRADGECVSPYRLQRLACNGPAALASTTTDMIPVRPTIPEACGLMLPLATRIV